MTQQQAPPYMAALLANDPKMAEILTANRDFIIQDGALSAKVKTLMTMMCDALLAHEDGVKAIADRARGMGASEEEIAETIRVAFWMGGLPALVTGMNAFRED
ncbi:MAG: carboxymuconolactone decarboxylase family protein [Chloroflexi bacterium]|nr:carboxymuconolactone decarboxylase family protein [Chloroflexota bacterium]